MGCPDAAGAGGRCRGAVAGAAAAAGLDPCPQVHRTPQQVQGAAATAGPWDAAAGPGLPRCRSRSTIAEERLEDSWAPLDETVATEELEEMIHSKEAHTNAVNLESLSLDIVKSLYAKFIDWDEDMYDLENDTPAHAANPLRNFLARSVFHPRLILAQLLPCQPSMV
ncbi:hypothetical protein PVAP13_8NG256900 [Panicum virgatum]|uniref:Uncharacterized protein n=1 Tax=Panicum virgatum TaxID=38727 RepID=A0A8T0P5X3_PANVG|nr:hypothetical protein PVAP13_8NG256900 [Panicum virgatum]